MATPSIPPVKPPLVSPAALSYYQREHLPEFASAATSSRNCIQWSEKESDYSDSKREPPLAEFPSQSRTVRAIGLAAATLLHPPSSLAMRIYPDFSSYAGSLL